MAQKKIDIVTWLKNWFEQTSNKVTSWGNTPSNNNYPSEKLVKDSLDEKANSTHTHTSLQKTTITSGNLDDYTDTGWYSYSTTDSSSITNTPENVGSVMEVLDDYGNGRYIVQKVYTLPSDNNSIIYYRQKYDSTGWGEWIRIDGRDKITQGNIQGGVNLLGQWLISYTNASAGAVVTQQNNVLFHGDEVVRINNSSISDAKKYTDMYWETPYTEFGYNDVFTFSFYAKGTNNAQIKTYFYGESGYITVKRLSSNSTVSGNDTEYSSFNDGNTTFTLGSDWQFYTVTYKLNSTGTTTAIKKPVIRVFGGTDCYVSCAKLERGFNATDFNNGTGIKSIKIEAASTRTKDLNNYTKTGFYYNNLNTDCAYISNLPVSNKAFFLTVENWGGSTTYLKQTCTVYSPVETYVRVKNVGTWGAWKKLISVDDASSSRGLADDPYNGLVGTSTKYAREDHAHGKLYHWSTGDVSTATYVDLLEFTMTTSYQDIPITFVVRRRAKDRAYYVSIRFSNTNISTSTYSVTSFKHWGDVTAQTFYLRKVADNTYRLCTYKTANDVYYIDDVVNFNSGITITKIASANGNYGTTAPSGSAPDLYTSTQIGIPDTDLTWNGVATNNSISPLLMATDNEFGANRLAYFPPSRIKVEYSTNSGSTWTELTTGHYSEANKTKLVTTTSEYMFLGNNSTTDYSKNRLRITFDVGDMNTDSILYLVTRKIALFTGTANATGFTCQIQTQTYAQYNSNNQTFSNYGSAFALGGWSGWNTAPLDIILGGYKSSNQTNSSSGRIKALRLLFTQTGGTGNGFVAKVRLYGETAHKTASQYANNNHIYTINENQDATFPSKIIKEGGTSSQFLMANGDVQNKVTSWSNTPSDVNIPSEKLVKTEINSIQETIGSNSPQIMKVEYIERQYQNTSGRQLVIQVTCDVPITRGNIVANSNDGANTSIKTLSGSDNMMICTFGIYDANESDTFNITLKNNNGVITDTYSFSYTFSGNNNYWVDTGYVNNSYSIRNEIDSLKNGLANILQYKKVASFQDNKIRVFANSFSACIFINGTFTVAANNVTTLCTIPSQYSPPNAITLPCNDSQTAHNYISIWTSDGKVNLRNRGTGTNVNAYNIVYYPLKDTIGV